MSDCSYLLLKSLLGILNLPHISSNSNILRTAHTSSSGIYIHTLQGGRVVEGGGGGGGGKPYTGQSTTLYMYTFTYTPLLEKERKDNALIKIQKQIDKPTVRGVFEIKSD